MGCFESKNEQTMGIVTVSKAALNGRASEIAPRTNLGVQNVTSTGMIQTEANKFIAEHPNNQLEGASEIAPRTNLGVQNVTSTGMIQTEANKFIAEHPNNQLEGMKTQRKKKSSNKSKKNKEKGTTEKVTEDGRINSSHNRIENERSMGNTVEASEIAPRTNLGVQNVTPTGMIQTESNKFIAEHPNNQLEGDETTKRALQSDTNKSNTNDTKDKAKEKSNEVRQPVDTLEERNSEHEAKQAHGYTEDTKTKNQDEPCPPERRTQKEKQESRETLKTALKKAEDELQTLKASSKKEREEFQKYALEKQEFQNKIKELEEEVDEITTRADKNMKKIEQVVKDKRAELQRLEYKINVMKSEKDDIIQNQERALTGKTKKIQSLEKEKDELLLRLSAMAGRRLTDNNPDITDLSDTNRPTKLAERYSELYDNEWTEAFSHLQTCDAYKNSEEEVISTLLEMLKIAYEVSCCTAEKQLTDLSRILFDFRESSERDVNMNDILKQMKDYRKKAVKPNKRMAEDYRRKVALALPKLPASSFTSGDLNEYLDKCLQLTWLMVIQDPPVHLGSEVCKRGDVFEKNHYKEYTESGNYVSYAVWPALFLQKNGPLLCKGVVQCSKQRLSGSFRSVEPQIKNREWKTKSLNNEKGVTTATKQSLHEAALKKEVTKEKNKNDKKEPDHSKSTKF